MNWISDFKWCIENDWQVYIKPINTLQCKIAIRKGGITAQGKDIYYNKITGEESFSREVLGEIVYVSQKKAMNKLPDVYKYLRETYE
jgi:hypothetical protein|tara:strand:+ start:6061 stop:6321 length:261 start_codon:yes stop_codon:yes gene_type:complete